MSRRWFVSSVGIGAAAVSTTVSGARPTFQPTVQVLRRIRDDEDRREMPGPSLQLIGPGDVTGFDSALVTRREPAAGAPDGVENNLACVEFSDASLPWLLSLPQGERPSMPWITLLVMRDDEAKLQPGEPLPTVTAPAAALPDLADAWAWAHVEARIEDAEAVENAVTMDVRSGVEKVISRLVCPRRLAENRGWLACVVPTTRAGVAAGLARDEPPETGAQPAWTPGQAGGVILPVYHSWTFRTGPAGSFEELARRVHPVQASTLDGFGTRAVNVRRPWPHQDLLAGAPDEVTVTIQGALRLPQTETKDEQWTDDGARDRFRALLRARLDAPAARRDPGMIGAEPDRDERAVAPPLYGSHHTGEQVVPDQGWMNSLNLQVRHRIAAGLGARYVQLEQEFLMARAWEQVGAVNEANRLLAAAELATEAGLQAQRKHVATMDPAALTELAAPMRHTVHISETEGSLDAALRDSATPGGVASTAFGRLTRAGGALNRRRIRAAGNLAAQLQSAPVLTQTLAGERLVPAQPATWLTGAAAAPAFSLAADPSMLASSNTLLTLLHGQQSMFDERSDHAGPDPSSAMTTITSTLAASLASPMGSYLSPQRLRGLRSSANAEQMVEPGVVDVTVRLNVAVLADSVRADLRPMTQQLSRIAAMVIEPTMPRRTEIDPRPLRPIMSHPHFGFPIAVELLTRWPDWAIPGISTFPDNSSTLLETNSGFIEALLVGLNQEFNRELLWREYPTDQAGTAFTRFWPPETAEPDFGEIARWRPDVALGDHDLTGGKDLLVLLVRGEVLRRYPGTVVLAARSVNRRLPVEPGGLWQDPKFVLPVDDHTTLYAFNLTADEAIADEWMFVMREPMRGTQFGFDLGPATPPPTWADLTWDDVPTVNGFVVPRRQGPRPPTPAQVPADDPPTWGRDAADIARIAMQRPFQLAFSPRRLIGEPPR